MDNTSFGLEPKAREQGGGNGNQRRLPLRRGALAEADPTSATVCHCRDCQKFTGSVLAALVRVPKEAMTIEGTLKTFSSIGGSGNPILRHFCPECGSSIAEEPATRPGMIILNVGTFDNPTVAKLGREIFRRDALPWIEVHGEIPRSAKRPD